MKWRKYSRCRGFRSFLWCLSKVYEFGARLHRFVYEKGWKSRRRLGCVVVSIGNISVGGSAKTPLVLEVSKRLAAKGLRVCVASRGYGRLESRQVEVVSDGAHTIDGWSKVGDEPFLISKSLPTVPVVVGRDRGLAGATALSRFGTEVLILDDGFQHHRLARDLDLVAIDADAGLEHSELLPLGRLREPVEALAHADAFVIVDGELRPSELLKLDIFAPGKPKFRANREPRRLFRLSGGVPRSLSSLKDKEVGLLCGIARPSSFKLTVESLGAKVVATKFYPDHHKYVGDNLRNLTDQAPFWVTTEKDAVKLDPTWLHNLQVLGIDLVLSEPFRFEEFLSGIVEEAISLRSFRQGKRERGV